ALLEVAPVFVQHGRVVAAQQGVLPFLHLLLEIDLCPQYLRCTVVVGGNLVAEFAHAAPYLEQRKACRRQQDGNHQADDERQLTGERRFIAHGCIRSDRWCGLSGFQPRWCSGCHPAWPWIIRALSVRYVGTPAAPVQPASYVVLASMQAAGLACI